MENLWNPSLNLLAAPRNEMMDEVASEYQRIQSSRGNYEAELSSTGEAGLQHCLVMCQKNPGHLNFIPTKDFTIEHLPCHCRDNLIMDIIRATSDITCRLSVTGISGDRPDTWPDSNMSFPFSVNKGKNLMMTGTGWVSYVEKYAEQDDIDCECDDCCRPGADTPKKIWGNIRIRTACHVVYDVEEARHTKCHFFYDSHETSINKALTLTGVKFRHRDLKGDFCEMVYITHDMELLEKFYKMWWHWRDLHDKVEAKHYSKKKPGMCVPGVGYDLCVVVSHPHGRSKHISVGTCTQKRVVDKHYDRGAIMYSYNAPTCPGSSGAPVFTLWEDNRRKAFFYQPPPHSQGRFGNDNNSGVGWEWVDKPLI